ncbi:putative phosducin-like protein 3 [Iris pallida]|uniref:Phosducin-like protein 3 n=1 Tax=Iris pallida TaxID=29817 RepID=A0AAX6GWK2_IRIPA|nr:putative phosducin-like protein 3 [Iris pallida]KAJ6833136.1 putative phosducin-like protein 3 [Iris pallida]
MSGSSSSSTRMDISTIGRETLIAEKRAVYANSYYILNLCVFSGGISIFKRNHFQILMDVIKLFRYLLYLFLIAGLP